MRDYSRTGCDKLLRYITHKVAAVWSHIPERICQPFLPVFGLVSFSCRPLSSLLGVLFLCSNIEILSHVPGDPLIPVRPETGGFFLQPATGKNTHFQRNTHYIKHKRRHISQVKNDGISPVPASIPGPSRVFPGDSPVLSWCGRGRFHGTVFFNLESL